MKTRYGDIPAYITKDGSEIRELIHPIQHGVQHQSLAEAIVPPSTAARHIPTKTRKYSMPGNTRKPMKSLTLILALRLLSLSLCLCLLALPVTVRAADPPASPVTDQAPVTESALTQVLVLMDARLKLAPDVARYKWNAHGAIEDRVREGKIIAALGQQAAQRGLPPDWAERFFRAQIEASKAIQFELFEQWQRQGAGPFAQAPDLALETRPKLDRLTPQLLQALAAAWPLLCNAAPRDEIATRIQQYWATAAYRSAVAELASAPLMTACECAVRRRQNPQGTRDRTHGINKSGEVFQLACAIGDG